ncbi:MAG: pyridoxal phosphate-dependent aminotransferase [Chthoniobacterales bacterium]
MNLAQRQKSSDYMEWAKLHSHARFNLATSGILSVAAADFPAPNEQLEINAPGAYGYAPLQERIARHEGVTPECIVAAAGTSMANHLAMAAVLEPGDEVLLEQPTYGLLLDVANYLGASIKRFQRQPESNFDIDLQEIADACSSKTKLIVLTNLHNPSGALIPEETLRAIGAIAQRGGAQVLLDEVYAEMIWDRMRTQPGEEFIITNSLTKAYGLSGLRCGWIVASPQLARGMWRLNDLFGVNAAFPADQLSVSAFDHLEKFRERARLLLEANRPLIDAFLDSRRDLQCFRPSAGTVFFPRLLKGDTEALVRLLREKFETSVVPGKFFEMPQHFRIGIGGETAELQAGLERLGNALDELS